MSKIKTKKVPVKIIKRVRDVLEYIYAEALYELPIQYSTKKLNTVIDSLNITNDYFNKVKL